MRAESGRCQGPSGNDPRAGYHQVSKTSTKPLWLGDYSMPSSALSSGTGTSKNNKNHSGLNPPRVSTHGLGKGPPNR